MIGKNKKMPRKVLFFLLFEEVFKPSAAECNFTRWPSLTELVKSLLLL